MLRWILTVVLLAAGLPYSIKFMKEFGLFVQDHKHHPGKCRRLNENWFSFEDFHVTSKGHAFISSGVRFEAMGPALHRFYDKYNIKGKMFFFNFNKPNDRMTELNIVTSPTFNSDNFYPHGLSLLEDKDKGEHLLYVVNHPTGEDDKIEKFRYQPSSKNLVHVKTFLSEKFELLNDIAVVKEDVFYLSNYLNKNGPLMARLKYLFKWKSNNILLYNGSETITAVPELHGPNGVLLSPDGKHLYVALPHLLKMSVYSRNPTNHSLTLTQDVMLHTSGDNFHFSQSGDALYLACHPSFYLGLRKMQDPENNLAPSQVLRLPVSQGLVVEEDITEPFYDHGHLISGSSVAAVYNDLLLVGSVSNNIVLCETNDPLHS